MVLPHTKNIFDYPARFQYQSGAPCLGKSCCTDTCIQEIVEFYKDRTYSLSSIRRVAQAKTNYDERPCTGINYIEVQNALQALGVYNYRVATKIDIGFVLSKLSYGPVLLGVHYGSYPNWYRGSHTNKAEYGGRTDYNFRGAHAVLVIGTREHKNSAGKYLHRDFYVRDPDHHSPSRREAPKYDIVTAGQLKRAMNNLPTYTKFTTTYCMYSVKKK